jgi:hypothetical protein
MTSTPNNKRLVLAVYRSMLRWCNEVDPNIPLADLFIEYSNNNLGFSKRTFDDDNSTVRDVIRESFRSEGGDEKKRIAKAMSALRHLNDLKPLLLASSVEQSNSLVDHLVDILHQDDDFDDALDLGDSTEANDVLTKKLIDTVDWLPAMDEMTTSASADDDEEGDDDATTSILPLFPLGGPLYSSDNGALLPLFTSYSDIPIPGMEISLKIFEPRYRQLYQDILTSGTKKFVVPFCHPTIPSKYARHGLLYEVVQVQEVADQTNGVIQYLANHLVTKPIYIERICNPKAWSTGMAYLKVRGRVVNDEFAITVEPLERMLQDWVDDESSSSTLPVRALGGLRSEGLWGFVNTWNMYLQQELLNLQVQIAAAIQVREVEEADAGEERRLEITKEMQQPHRPRLLSLQLDIALLVPTLLQQYSVSDDGDNRQIEYLLQVIAKERQFLEQAAGKDFSKR